MTQQPAKARSRTILTVLRICVALAALTFLLCIQDWPQLRKAFASLNVWVIFVPVGMMLVGNILIGLRWFILLRTQKADVHPLATIKIHFIGLFYNNLMLSSVGGDMLRAWYVTKHTQKRFEAVLSVFVDRAIGLGTMVLMALLFYLLYPVNGEFLAQKTSQNDAISAQNSLLSSLFEHKWLILGAFFAVFFVFLLTFSTQKGKKFLRSCIDAILSHRQRAVSAIKIYCKKPLVILLSMLLTFLCQGLVIIGFAVVGSSLGMDIPIKYYFVFFPISWVLAAIPVSPGGVGVLELGLVGLFSLLPGATTEQAMTLAVCQRIVIVLCAIPGVIIHLSGTHLPGKSDLAEVDMGQ